MGHTGKLTNIFVPVFALWSKDKKGKKKIYFTAFVYNIAIPKGRQGSIRKSEQGSVLSPWLYWWGLGKTSRLLMTLCSCPLYESSNGRGGVRHHAWGRRKKNNVSWEVSAHGSKTFFFFYLGRSSLICWVQLPGTRSSGANAAPTLYKAASKTVFDNARKALTP